MSVEILASTVEPANNPSSISDHCGRILCRSRGFSVAINRTLPALFSVLYNPRASPNSLSHGWAGVVHPRWGLPARAARPALPVPQGELPPTAELLRRVPASSLCSTMPSQSRITTGAAWNRSRVSLFHRRPYSVMAGGLRVVCAGENLLQ